jgi:ribosome-associated protein
MFEINPHLCIADSEFQWAFVRSGGPGGQNVNKVASKAVLRWNVGASPSLPEEIKARLRTQQKNRITGQGELIISSQRFRDQERNKEDCLQKLRAMILQATTPPRPRKQSRPTRASKEARLETKRRRSQVKTRRRRPVEE